MQFGHEKSDPFGPTMRAYKHRLAIFFAIHVAVLVTTGAQAATATPLWRRVAEAPIIAVGKIKVPVKVIEECRASDRHEYVDLIIENAETLKGRANRSFVIRWYTEARSYAPGIETLLGLNGREVIIFAVLDGKGTRRGIYFAGYDSQAIVAADKPSLDEVRAEIAEQRRLVTQFPRGLAAVSTKNLEVVRRLLDETTMKGKAEAAFTKLLDLGLEFVPAIIVLMDDRREVAAEWLTIPNSPQHWEAHALYKPEEVVDALDGILVRKTGVGFVNIVNGSSDDNRQATVDAWRVYLYRSSRR